MFITQGVSWVDYIIMSLFASMITRMTKGLSAVIHCDLLHHYFLIGPNLVGFTQPIKPYTRHCPFSTHNVYQANIRDITLLKEHGERYSTQMGKKIKC